MKVVNPNNLPVAPISEFKVLQGQLKFLNKENYDKLKGSIQRDGFFMPVAAWIDEDGQKWLVDGTQRSHVLTTEGWTDPIPYLTIKAKNQAEAADKLLRVTSQFGTITQEGLDEMIARFELPEVDVLAHTNFDGIFNFTVEEPEDEPVEHEPEIEDTGMSLRLNIVDNGEHFVVKATEGKKTNTIGSFVQWEEAREATVEFLNDYEPKSV